MRGRQEVEQRSSSFDAVKFVTLRTLDCRFNFCKVKAWVERNIVFPIGATTQPQLNPLWACVCTLRCVPTRFVVFCCYQIS